jgi:hypothetical protein
MEESHRAGLALPTFMKWIIAPEWGIGPAFARSVVAVAIADRFAACKLVPHPEKTRILHRKGVNRRSDFSSIRFDFLGFQLRARKSCG